MIEVFKNILSISVELKKLSAPVRVAVLTIQSQYSNLPHPLSYCVLTVGRPPARTLHSAFSAIG